MEGVLVTVETRLLDNGTWEAVAYLGDGTLRVTAATEDALPASFIDTWNSERGTGYGAEEFSFVRQS